MSDTQKTTKGVREAATASQGKRADASAIATVFAYMQAKKLPGSWSSEVVSASPRYSVKLTTEGWQAKDNETGRIRADVFSSKVEAEGYARIWNNESSH